MSPEGGWSQTLGNLRSPRPPFPYCLHGHLQARQGHGGRENPPVLRVHTQSLTPFRGITEGLGLSGGVGGRAGKQKTPGVSENDRQRGHGGREHPSWENLEGPLGGREGSEQGKASLAKARASCPGSHGNRERVWATKGLSALGQVTEGLTSPVLSCRHEEQRQALLQRFPRRPAGRPQPSWKEQTESCDYMRVSVPRFYFYFLGLTPTSRLLFLGEGIENLLFGPRGFCC